MIHLYATVSSAKLTNFNQSTNVTKYLQNTYGYKSECICSTTHDHISDINENFWVSNEEVNMQNVSITQKAEQKQNNIIHLRATAVHRQSWYHLPAVYRTYSYLVSI